MNNFVINGVAWDIEFVRPNDSRLRRSDNSITCGCCDMGDKCIYLSDALRGAFLERVLCHELTHAVCLSWNISIPLETEEWLCCFMSEHGKSIIYLLDDLIRGIFYKVV